MVILVDGRREWRLTDGGLHRDGDLPAVIWPDGTREWWYMRRRHRKSGPAVVYPDGGFLWYWEGERVTAEEWAARRYAGQADQNHKEQDDHDVPLSALVS
jgi:hypothetical protein